MRILLCTGDGGGNVPPIVAIAKELVRRGHTVRLLAGPYYPGGPRSAPLEEAFSAAGCEVSSPDAAAWLGGAGQIPDLNSIPEHLMMVRTMSLWTPVTIPWATETMKEIQSFEPAVVVTDLVTPGAGIAAEAAGIPRVVLLATVPVHRLLPGLPVPGRGAPPGEDDPARREEFMRISLEMSLPWINAARERLGLDLDDDPWAWEDRAERVLVLSSQAFDFPAVAYPPNVVYTGSVRPIAGSIVADMSWDGGGESPLVVVSGTTTGLSGLWYGAFRGAANALVDLGMRSLLTIGPLDPQTLPQHESLRYRSFVPHTAVLPAASAMVTQCGHGATIAALRHGVPMVCVPVFADQPDVASRVAHHGAGITLSTLSSTDEFREAIAAVVRESRYREAAGELAGKLADEDGVTRAADEIELVCGV